MVCSRRPNTAKSNWQQHRKRYRKIRNQLKRSLKFGFITGTFSSCGKEFTAINTTTWVRISVTGELIFRHHQKYLCIIQKKIDFMFFGFLAYCLLFHHYKFVSESHFLCPSRLDLNWVFKNLPLLLVMFAIKSNVQSINLFFCFHVFKNRFCCKINFKFSIIFHSHFGIRITTEKSKIKWSKFCKISWLNVFTEIPVKLSFFFLKCYLHF